MTFGSKSNRPSMGAAMILMLLSVGLVFDDGGDLTGQATGSRGGCGGSGSSTPSICSESRPCLEGETCRDGECVSDASEAEVHYVQAFDRELIKWASPHVTTFEFPTADTAYESVTLYMTIACPEVPGDCDPWDRTGDLKVVSDDGEHFEIARFITPYDITGSWGSGSGPGSCEWAIDVTPYQSLLRGSVSLRLFITTWIGGNRGWLISTRFGFREGSPTSVPYRVVNLWNHGGVLYGDPNHPIDEHLQPITVPIDGETIGAKVRAIVTGHGQGNTDNAAEFTHRWHRITTGQSNLQWTPWREDCGENICSPQGGNWQPGRAGWCPGDSVRPTEFELGSAVSGQSSLTLDYDVEPYENCCRPDNPSCDAQDGSCCISFAGECGWNQSGHTSPNWRIGSQLILYRSVR